MLDPRAFFINSKTGRVVATTFIEFLSGNSTTPSICFTDSPDSGLQCNSSGVVNYIKNGVNQGEINTPADGSVTTEKLASNLTINVADGTQGTPSIQFNGSGTDTGFYSPGANQVALSTSGTGRLFVDASGNVGVGASVPTASLHVSADNPSIFIQDANSTGNAINATIQFRDSSDTQQAYFGYASGSDSHFSLFNKLSGGDLRFGASNTERLRITSAGQLSFIGAGSSGSPAVGFNGSAPSNSLVINSTGLVGIGSSSPGYALDIRGTQDDATNFLFNGLNVVNTTNQGGVSNKTAIRLGVTSDSGIRAAKVVAFEDGNNTFNVGLGFDVNSTDAADSTTRALTIKSNGTVGIGTTSPSRGPLHLHQDGATNTYLKLTNGTTGNTGSDGLEIVVNTTGGVLVNNRESTELAFATAGTERARIDSSGTFRVKGAGTGGVNYAASFSGSAPVDSLNLDSSGRLLVGTSSAPSTGAQAPYARLGVFGNIFDNTAAGYVNIGRNETASNMSSNDGIGEIIFPDSAGGQFARIGCFVDGTPGTNDYPSRLVFSTCASGESSPTERMRISNQGNHYHFGDSGQTVVWANTPNAANSSGILFRGMHSATSIVTGGTDCFYVYANGNVVNTNNSYGAISDIKLKENIVDASSQWDDIKALRPVNYNFKEGQTHTQLGLIAQEVELVSPGLVSESPDRDEDGNDLGTVTKSVNYSVLYMKAVKALQEAMERIETLEAKVAALESA